MKFISTHGKSKPVSFSAAALHGLAPDGGLYMPVSWPSINSCFINNLQEKNLYQAGLEVARLFIDELDDAALRKLIGEVLNFEVPLHKLDENRYILELFHGPTLAFKDFGARFMSHFFAALRNDHDEDLIILAATSGDTGSAVAQGFLGIDGIQVCLLYPSGKVSRIQEQQLTTAGQNITALEVDGTFDDCQHMVKQAFSDTTLNDALSLSSANSINIARLLPQSFYYFYALSQLKNDEAPIFCVPSGNFGNLTAGLMAHAMGMPARGFIAATNANDIVPSYLKDGKYEPRPSKRTLSNAMDVGHPSNFDRILNLFEGSHEKIKQQLWGASFSDEQTKQAIREVYENHHYIVDPHTAVGYLAVQQYLENGNNWFGEAEDTPFIMLSTAHPAKFRDVIEPVIGEKVPMPKRLSDCLSKQKQSVPMQADAQKFKEWLLNYYR